jgi:methyl-accepting chemotaxis protein
MSRQVKKDKTSRSLTATLAIAFLALSVVVLFIAGSFQLSLYFQTQREIAAGQQQLIAQDAANEVASFVQEKFSLLEAAIKFGHPDAVSPAEQTQVLESLLGLEPAFRHLVLFDAQEQELAKVSRLSQAILRSLTELLESELFVQVRQGNRYISSVYVDDASSEPMVIIAVPVLDPFGDFQGTLVAEVNLKFMWDLMDRLEIGQTGLAYVVDRQGDLIAFGDIARVLRGENMAHLREVDEFIHSSAAVDETGANMSSGINGTTIVGTYVPLGTPDWAVVTELPVGEAYREVIRSAVISVGVMLAIGLLAGLIGVYVAQRLAVPLRNLTETAAQIAGGETGLQAAIAGPAEVVSLAKAFNSMTAQLRELIGSLEQRVAERTHQLEAAAQVAREAVAIRDADRLLDQTTRLISERFGFYHVSIFLLDEAGEYAVLQAASSEGGQRMLASAHKLKVGRSGIVGYVAGTGKSRIALDVGEDTAFFGNPNLPETRSEMALPLKVQERVIGVLDVQSAEAAAFSDEDVAVVQVMADQLAVAIENAQLLRATQQTVYELSAAVSEILAVTTQQVAGASEQSAAISQTMTTVDEVKTIADQSVARAQEVADASQRTVEVSSAGRRAVQETIESIAQIKVQVEGIAENILVLSERMQQIGQIIATVNDIASQSNMLALNAAVEAARAGEQGKGFAVVAAEVRNLAEQSKQATEQVKAILEDIQRATNMTVMATEEGTKRVEEGVRLAAQTGEVIQQLANTITESSQAAMQMVAGGRQQTSGIEQIALAMGNINQATAQGLSSTQQAEKTAQDLNDLARRLTETVEQYQL